MTLFLYNRYHRQEISLNELYKQYEKHTNERKKC